MISPRRFLSDETASSATEMALLVPLLVTLMFGGMEAGYYFWNSHRVVKAVRDGARYAGRQPFNTYDCTSASGFNSAAAPVTGTISPETAIKNLTRTGTINAAQKPVVPGWGNGGVTISITCGNTAAGSATNTGIFSGRTSGAIRVRVFANTSYRPLFSTLGFSTVNLGLAASSEAVVTGA